MGGTISFQEPLSSWDSRPQVADPMGNRVRSMTAHRAPGLSGAAEEILLKDVLARSIPRCSAGSTEAALVEDRVRWVGDYVAFVVAETVHQAADAAELIAVKYERFRRSSDRRCNRARRAARLGGLS